MLLTDLFTFLTSGPMLAVITATVGGLSAFFISIRQQRPSIENAREAAIQSAYKMGDELRDELRSDLKEAKEYARAVELRFVERMNALQQELSATKATLRSVERMRCPRTDCPVFRAEAG